MVDRWGFEPHASAVFRYALVDLSVVDWNQVLQEIKEFADIAMAYKDIASF